MALKTCGEALISLLEKYDVDTVFGIPGVHTLEIYRGLANSGIRHVLPRHEQGAGFMADGYARVTGKPGVLTIISGPGVTNALTALGHSYGDSIPILVISSVNRSDSHGKGWGTLHELTDQEAISAPVTAFSVTARRPQDIPELLAKAFGVFASQRPRPVHIAVPTDVLTTLVDDCDWVAWPLPQRPQPSAVQIEQAADLLASAERPAIIVGGGALAAGDALTGIAERVAALVLPSNAGKGVVPDSHPLSLGCTISRRESLELLAAADVVLAIGTELAETDSYIPKLPINGKLIRIDIDSEKLNNHYQASIGIWSDAAVAAEALLVALMARGVQRDMSAVVAQVAEAKAAAMQPLNDVEAQHLRWLAVVREALGDDGVVMGDMTQIVYTGTFGYEANRPNRWHYAGGFGTLGPALPMAIGAKVGRPDAAVAALIGDAGFMFTMPELAAAAEEKVALPIIIWNNAALGQIEEDMIRLDIDPVGVKATPPNFDLLAQSLGCGYARGDSAESLKTAITQALAGEQPVLIEVRQTI